MRLLPLILLAVASVPASRPTATSEEPDGRSKLFYEGWSKPVNGLQARLCFAQKETMNGTPIITTYLELRNVSDRADPIQVPFDEAAFEYTLTTAAGKAVPPADGPYDELTAGRGVIRLPHDSLLRMNVAHRGAGVPKDQAGLLDLGAMSHWVFKSGNERTYHLRATVTVKATDDKHWSGTLQLPAVSLPPLKKDR
jgi:hypothetical protein